MRLVSDVDSLTADADACAAELDAIRNGPAAPLRVSACAGAVEHLAADWDRRRKPEDGDWRLPFETLCEPWSTPQSETRGALRARVRAALLVRPPPDPWARDHRLEQSWRNPPGHDVRLNVYLLNTDTWTPELDALVRAQAERATKDVLVGVAGGRYALTGALETLRDVRAWLEELGRLRALKGPNQ